jgi:hypothetical protein
LEGRSPSESKSKPNNKSPVAAVITISILLFILAYFVFSQPPQEQEGAVSNIEVSIGEISDILDSNASSTNPQIAVYGNSTYVVWQDNSNGNDEIYLKMSPAGKSDFGRIFNLSRNNASSTNPQIAVYGNSTYVVWQDNSRGTITDNFASLKNFSDLS